MSAFNTIEASASCPRCKRTAEFGVQFKYGNTWQHSYRVGDSLRWGGNDVGIPGRKRVLVEGIGGPCPHCGADNLDFDVVIEDDKIVGITPVQGDRPPTGPEGFVVIEP